VAEHVPDLGLALRAPFVQSTMTALVFAGLVPTTAPSRTISSAIAQPSRSAAQPGASQPSTLVILFATVCLLVATLGTPALATAMTNMPTTNTKLMPPNMVLDPYYGDPTHLYAHLHFYWLGMNAPSLRAPR
jgi:hypothetical protein